VKIKREVKIALVVILAIAIFVWGFNFLKGKNVFSSKRYLYAVYDQINGLVEANPVLVNGLKIGQVDDIFFKPDGSGKIIVKMLITNSDIKIPKNAVAKIFASDFMGSKAIDLKMADTTFGKKINLKTGWAKSGDTLQSAIATSIQEEVSVQMLPLKQKAERMMSSMDSVLAVIQYVFNEDTRENLAKSFESIKFTIKNLESTTFNIDTFVTTERYRLSSILANVESISSNIKNNNQKITNIINNFSSLSDSISKSKIVSTIDNANKAITDFSTIMDKINKGEGSMGMLIHNDTLYRNLQKSSRDLDLLMEDMRLNPKRYVHFSVFGRSGKKQPYKAPK
jgi:phospholipid/cholesterol/gamma-HCH transport system substrate-binding protein